MQAKSLKTFDRQIHRIQTQLTKLGPMRPGTLTRQYRRPQSQQGAYYQLSYTYQMRSHTEYVPKREVAMVRKEIAAYRHYKKLTARWLDLALERSRLRMQLARLTEPRAKAKKGKGPQRILTTPNSKSPANPALCTGQ
jgi:hypothetical protein